MPTLTIAITAATPIIIPSMVRSVRNLLAIRLKPAIFKSSVKSILQTPLNNVYNFVRILANILDNLPVFDENLTVGGLRNVGLMCD